jgi:Family of unknown function (DUF6535)
VPPAGPGPDISSLPGSWPGSSQDEDFGDRAAEFWSVYVNEAQSHDDALIGTWKDDMEAILLFVRSPLILPPYSPRAISLFIIPIRPAYTRPL